MTTYQLRPGASWPGFLPGIVYRFLREAVPPGYVYLELHGQERGVRIAEFALVEDS